MEVNLGVPEGEVDEFDTDLPVDLPAHERNLVDARNHLQNVLQRAKLFRTNERM